MHRTVANKNGGENITLSASEEADVKRGWIKAEEERVVKEAKAAEKEKEKLSGCTKLEALGLTPSEVTALFS